MSCCDVVLRPELQARLAATVPLTLVSAPAGFGKTTLLTSWLAMLVSGVGALAALPIAAWEFSLGVWLVVKGFRPAALAALLDRP